LDLQIQPVVPETEQILNPFSTDMIFRARSNFWNEWVPNADLFPTNNTNSSDPWLGVNMHNPMGRMNTMTGSMLSESQLDLQSGFDTGNILGVDPLQGYLGSLDPSDMLVAYMLESAQQS
jgi:hypothetical protein